MSYTIERESKRRSHCRPPRPDPPCTSPLTKVITLINTAPIAAGATGTLQRVTRTGETKAAIFAQRDVILSFQITAIQPNANYPSTTPITLQLNPTTTGTYLVNLGTISDISTTTGPGTVEKISYIPISPFQLTLLNGGTSTTALPANSVEVTLILSNDCGYVAAQFPTLGLSQVFSKLTLEQLVSSITGNND